MNNIRYIDMFEGVSCGCDTIDLFHDCEVVCIVYVDCLPVACMTGLCRCMESLFPVVVC